MQRIARINPEDASKASAELLSNVKQQLGLIPNIIATLAQSPAALGGYLGLSGALSGGRLDTARREQIALAVAGANGCDYCASAHSALGGNAGLAPEEIRRNLRGESGDPQVAAALKFATAVVATRGHVSDESLAEVRAGGFSDEEIVEIVGNVALNIFTNYFNHVAGTEIDFPVVRATAEAA